MGTDRASMGDLRGRVEYVVILWLRSPKGSLGKDVCRWGTGNSEGVWVALQPMPGPLRAA